MTVARLRLIGDVLVLPGGDLLDGGAIDVGPDGRILDAGTEASLGPAPEAVDRIGGLLMPGLVNAHAHTPMSLLRSAGDGLPLQRWLTEQIWPREAKLSAEDAHWGMVLGSTEMLLAGVTTSCEMYFYEDAMVEAVRRTGARLVMTPGVISALLPGGDVAPRIAQLEEIHRTHHDPGGPVTVGFAPHSPYDLTPEQITEIARLAQGLGTILHIHLEETEAERQVVLERDGRTATQMLADIGALDGPVLGAHGVWLDDADRRLLADAGASIAHCPVSNLKLGSGIAEVVELLEAGVNVALGTDGVASNDNHDLWEELKLAPLLARGSRHEPAAMSAATSLHLATSGGAKAVGLPDVGEFRAGAWADVVRVDLDQPAFTPGVDLLTHLVFAGSSRHVTDVWVAGERVVQNRVPTKVDLSEAVAECRTRGRRIHG